MGTFALRLRYPRVPRRLVHDCDLQLPPDPVLLSQLTQLLQAAGWRVTLWEQPVPLPLHGSALVGRYYLRARRAGAVLDCAYENDDLAWPDFAAGCQWHQGLPLLRAEVILQQKAQAARPTDVRFLAWWRQHIGPLPKT
ncbi:hypothetical protein [Hymenobacter sp. B81]|uniref:hypothetical protein n=1 Tax=Hymenobacter sp. B81 TaxID=3344878 RepID=UPI0037DD9C50